MHFLEHHECGLAEFHPKRDHLSNWGKHWFGKLPRGVRDATQPSSGHQAPTTNLGGWPEKVTKTHLEVINGGFQYKGSGSHAKAPVGAT